MAKSFLTDINLNNNVLLNAKIQAWGSAPTGTTNPSGTGTAVAGQISSYLGALWVFNGTAWVQVGNTLSDSVSTTSSTTGASSTAVKTAYDLANAALPKSGGTMSGNIAMGGGNISGGGTFTATSLVGALTGNASTATSAGKWTTAVNLAGNSVDGSASVAFANKFIVQGTTDAGLSGAQFLGALGTGIVKNTTSTGVLSIAVAGDFPTLNQNTTGSAGSTTGTLTFGTGLTAGGASFNGSANVTITPVSATTSVAGIVQLSDSTSTTSSTLAATATAAKAAYDRGSTGVSDAATAQTTANAALPKAGGTMSGAIAMGNSKITGLGAPTADTDAATKLYVDTVSAGINVHEAVKYATTGALGTTGNLVGGTITTTYSNGTSGLGATLTIATSTNWTAITIDAQSLTVTDRVLIKNQAADLQNGIYTVTSVGAVGNTTSFVFTRAVDNDQSPEIDAGDLTYVIAGTANAGDGYVQTVANVVVGTTGVVWTQFSGSGAVPIATDAAPGIASFPTAQFSVSGAGAVTIGTLNTSVLNAGQLSGARGGTGVDNGSKTITVSGNTTIGSSTHTVAFATGGNTTVTLPASGTLATLAGSEALTGKTYNGLTVTTSTGTLTIGTGSTLVTSGAFTTTLTSTATTNATIPAGTVTLVDLASSQALTSKTYNGLTISGSAGTLTIPTGSTLATSGAFATTLTVTGATNVTLPTTGTLMTTSGNTTGSAATLTTSRSLWGQSFNGSAAITGPITGATTVTGTAGTTFTVQAAEYASTSGQGPHTYVRGGYATAATGTAQGGNVYIWAGGSDSVSGTAGSVNVGAGEVVNITGSTVTVGGTVRLTNVQSGSAGFVKIAATTGQLSTAATVAYSEMATSTSTATATAAAATGNVTSARKAIGVGIGTGTAMVVNHGLGQWVTAQLYDTSGNLVEVDVLNASTSGGTTTFTFASSQTLTGFQYVIVG